MTMTGLNLKENNTEYDAARGKAAPSRIYVLACVFNNTTLKNGQTDSSTIAVVFERRVSRITYHGAVFSARTWFLAPRTL